MLIYHQCWKNGCSLIFFGTCDLFQDTLRNKKLKRIVFIPNIHLVLQYTLLLGLVNFFLSYLFIFLINAVLSKFLLA